MPDAKPTLPPSERRQRRIERLSYLLDNAFRIPILNYRVGWDALIGLIPGAGDVAGLLLSGYLVVEAARFGLPKATLLRMLFNIAVEALLGAFPVLGDVFDATWKANARNAALLQAHLGAEAPRQRQADRRGVALVVGVVLLVILGLLGLLGVAVWGLNRLLGI